MKPSKTSVKKILSIINSSKKKVFTCDNLSKASGFKIDVIKDYISNFYGMINLDDQYNLKDLVPELEAYLASLENNTKKKPLKKISHKEYAQYKSFLDFVNKKMTSGGILDMGYQLTSEDKKIIKHFLQKK